MNRYLRRFFISAVLISILLIGTAAAFADCQCLDENGNPYPEGTSTSVVCYVLNGEEYEPSGNTYGQCYADGFEKTDPVQNEQSNVTVQSVNGQEPAAPAAQTSTPAAGSEQGTAGDEGGSDLGSAGNSVVTDPTADPTEEPTEDPNNETPTEDSTEETTEDSTEDSTEETTEDSTEDSTEETTEDSTEASTEETTEDSTGTSTDDSTEDSTGTPTEDSTGTPTEDSTDTPTEEPTEEPTVDPETEAAIKDAQDQLMKLTGVEIGGKLSSLSLSTPADSDTITSLPVTFTWVYATSDQNPVDVEFKLTLLISDTDSGTSTSAEVSVNSASCANAICTYTSGSELAVRNGSVTWSVSGTYTDGGNPVTVAAANPASKTFNMQVSSDPTPDPTQKPAAPVLECPKGRYMVRTLGFYWAPSQDADTYTVNWSDDKGHSGNMTLSNSDASCQAGRCITYATLPGTGKYTWTVTARNTAGTATSKSMSFEIASNVTTPTPYAPNSSYYNRNYPAFQWEDVQDGVTDYRVQVVGKYNNHIYWDRWFSTSELYIGDGVCYVQTDLFLPAGTYSWRVLGKNSEFSSGWSSWLDFTVNCDYCNYTGAYYGTYTNTVPTPTYPTATITVVNPDFQWRTLTGAAYYIVDVYDASGKQVIEQNVNATNCTAELCTWKPNFTLPGNGSYTWSVKGYGANNGLWGSATGSFTLQTTIKMNPITFRSPVDGGYLSQDIPLVIWTDPGDTCVMFEISVYDNTNAKLLTAQLNREQAWCDGLTCSIQFATIPDGENYKISVTPYSELNTAGETVSLTFSKGVQPLKLTSPKEGTVTQSRPMFRWTLDAGEGASYELLITDSAGVETLISPLLCGENGVTCEEGEAFYIPTDALASGSYSAKMGVQGASSIGEVVNFSVK